MPGPALVGGLRLAIMAKLLVRTILGSLLAVTAAACGSKEPSSEYGAGSYANPAAVFKDTAQSNVDPKPQSLDLVFVDQNGASVDINSFRGKKNVVLVFTRGFPGYVCPYCSALTSRLISNYQEFTKRDAEVLVIFPGPKDQLKQFITASQAQALNNPVPFPILLDENFKAVDKLGIRGNLVKPSTYILDKKGQVRFAYVGSTSTDRPSVKAMLEQLDALSRS
jgi:peroxiredoxin